jgi:hypothetical protein
MQIYLCYLGLLLVLEDLRAASSRRSLRPSIMNSAKFSLFRSIDVGCVLHFGILLSSWVTCWHAECRAVMAARHTDTFTCIAGVKKESHVLLYMR